ncbi:type VII secretion protein EccB [Mycobacterium nebraskense]|uniref:Type VII secretion protein EccB n=1 Tax=Mycobacterium nebraskense TaxID=244292 RepID=A0A0F5N185_9MYCO|nr:type VII secretion protein EccB [Mycobacterium nebraskense]KKC00766.1 secretion protein EccB [Mycobacterium nebraskense]KLO43411.1 secretion protein EccB [Mycobacterium nebraskense]MBI2694358.1 type VII secretion protein EccB [Mycobacterium nebraskense]MCV7120682.1 type VII secretion protein EccB [Mycobacterium nebraskense]ORW35422.1 type VII secretion protein EccB [Mycobacterium nebraskense]
MPRQPTTWLHVSGYRFLLRRVECALLGGNIHTLSTRPRAQTAALTIGCVLAAIAVAGAALVALLRPRVALDGAQLVMGRESGALYVRVGDTWHPVLNLASARLIATTAANPQPVPEADLTRAKRGPLLGIPGAPQLIGKPLSADESAWTICDTDGATTVIVGRIDDATTRRLSPGQAALVAPASGSPAYLLYDGKRAVVDVADPAVVRALRLEGRAPRPVSQPLLNAIPEAPPIRTPRIRGAGDKAAVLPGFVVGGVVRITRAGGDEYYVVLAAGVQRIGEVAADLLRFSDSQGTANAVTVAPDAIRAAPIVDSLPVGGFPDRAPAPPDNGSTLCTSSQAAPSGQSGVTFLAGSRLPLPAGQAPVTLSQADGHGPALDAVYMPPGRSAYVRAGTRYLVTDSGVRFAIHDDNAEHDLGLPAANPAPWPVVGALPAGPELSSEKASLARDSVAGTP